jgi:hypothetical protein
MSETQHPRHETDQQRRYWRGKLRSFAESKIKRHGQHFPVDSVAVFDCGLSFEDGAIGHLISIKGRQPDGEKIDNVVINLYHTADPTGPFTQYTSKSRGEFDRAEIDPQASGALSMEEMSELDVAVQGVAVSQGSLSAAQDQIRNRDEGVDGHPITAQEAGDVLQRLKLATIN